MYEKMKKALIFIDHDMIIRHFIMSNAFREIEEEYDVTYVFNDEGENKNKWIHSDVSELNIPDYKITNIPRQRMGSWYRIYAITILHNQRGSANYKGRKERITEAVGALRANAYSLLALPGIFKVVKKYYMKKQGVYEPLQKFIVELEPDILIHPSILTGFYINELLLISKNINIPLLVLMNSWDNPSQKAVVTGYPEKLAVWGETTKSHAIEYMKIEESKVEIFGAAQFQLYRNKVKESRKELCDLFKVPDDAPVILYAGVSKSINETRHLKLLEDAIETGSIEKCHIIYRPHPWRGGLIDGEVNFFDMDFKHVSMDPHMVSYYKGVVEKSSAAFDMADYKITQKLLQMVDGTISSLSTILLETILHGKPTISFMPKKDMENKYGKSASISFRLAHFTDLWKCPGVEICDSDEGLTDAVMKMLHQSKNAAIRNNIHEHAMKFVDLTGPTYGQRLLMHSNSLVGI